MVFSPGCGSSSRNTERQTASIEPANASCGTVLGEDTANLSRSEIIDPSQDPFETAEWDIVSFNDPRQDTDPYDIIDGRVLIAFCNPPTLPEVDPNYYDVERQDTDPVYNQVQYNYRVSTTADGVTILDDPQITAFVAAENLTVYSEWPMIAGIAAVLPDGQSVADAVLNWPSEYPGLVEAVDPDAIAVGAFPEEPPNEVWFNQQGSWYLYSDSYSSGNNYRVSSYSTDIGSIWHRGIISHGDSVLAIIDSGVDYSIFDMQSPSVAYGVNAGDKKANTQFLPRNSGGGEPWEWLMERSQANAIALGHGTCVAGAAVACVNNYNEKIESSNFSSMLPGGKYVSLAVKAKGGVNNEVYFSLSSLYNAITAMGTMKKLPGCLPSNNYSARYIPYYRIDTCNISISAPGTGVSLGNRLIDYIGDYILFVAAAGNNDTSGKAYWPACHAKVMAVTGHNKQGYRAMFSSGYGSNYQSYIDISAPGDDIRTCDMLGTTINGYHKGRYSDSEAIFWLGEGTSLAAPITAAATLVAEHHSTWPPVYVKWWINLNKNYDLPDPTVNQFGRLDMGTMF